MLYKYYPDNEEYIKNLILKNEIYFSSPVNFNDPYDCYPSIVFDGVTLKEKKDYYKKIIKDNFPSYSRQQRQEALKDALKNVDIKEFFAGENIQDRFMDIGVFCLSNDRSNILMWSHYAENHRGVCLGFEESVCDILSTAREVHYNKERYKINWIKERDKAASFMIESIFHKSSDWSYEKEFRVADPYMNGLMKFNIKSLTRIVFGEKTPCDLKEKIKLWVNEANLEVEYFQSGLHRRNYEMIVVPCK